MKSKNCECCLMPLSKDPKISGSEKYCSYCFSDGRVIAENMTLSEFQKKAYVGMTSRGQSRLVAWLFSKMIGFAPYWKNK